MPTHKTFCFEHLWRLDRIGVPVPSPQGDRLVVPVTSVTWPAKLKRGQRELEPENETHADLWLVDIATPGAGPRRLTWDGGSDPAWSPCGSWIVFTRQRSIPADEASKKRDDLPKQLWRLPMDGPGEAERVTSMPTTSRTFAGIFIPKALRSLWPATPPNRRGRTCAWKSPSSTSMSRRTSPPMHGWG